MRSGLDVKIFLWLQAAGVEQDFAAPLAGAFHHHLCNPFRIDFYVRQRVGEGICFRTGFGTSGPESRRGRAGDGHLIRAHPPPRPFSGPAGRR